jgi:phospholipid-binding lipoprotein MlaA
MIYLGQKTSLFPRVFGLDRPGKNPENLPLLRARGITAMRVLQALAIAFCGLVATACASTQSTPEMIANNDPYEATNRDTLKFNGKIDRYFVIPTVALYFVLVPEGGRRSVHHFLENLTLPTTFVNDMLQGELKRGGQTAARFLINSTIGFGGFLDPASKMKIPDHGEDFGQTLATWGVDEGPYLMLPFFGPSNPRDAFGLGADVALDPTNYIHYKQHLWWFAGQKYFTILDLRAQTYSTVQGIQRSSVDYYASLRSLYRQLRENAIRNGHPQKSGDLPDF